MIIQCTQCGTRYTIDPGRMNKPGQRLRCSKCKHVFSVQPPRQRVLVAKDSKDFQLSVQELLRDLPFDLFFAEDGEAALEKIRQVQPEVVILDVALPKIYGFELAETLRSDPRTQEIGIILLAAIHDKTRYKRLPESLYGADHYIEAHHIMDQLIPKIRDLMPEIGSQPTEGPSQSGLRSRAADKAPGDPVSEDTQRKAGRLARIILSDIALYNQEKIEEGIRNGDLEKRLAPELQEAEEMMIKRFPDVPMDYSRKLLKMEIAALMNNDRVARGVS